MTKTEICEITACIALKDKMRIENNMPIMEIYFHITINLTKRLATNTKKM